MIGLLNGAEANGGAISLGAAMGDAQFICFHYWLQWK